MKSLQINNSYVDTKINLRIENLPKKDISVLDCFHGEGILWGRIKKELPQKVNITGIDRKNYNNNALIGENLKYLKKIDLSNYDVIDLDAYGTPVKQLEAILKNGTFKEVVVFYTFIQSLFGGLPHVMLEKLGYTKKMIKKIPSLFNKNGLDKYYYYLQKVGVKRIKNYNINNKNYGCFILKKN